MFYYQLQGYAEFLTGVVKRNAESVTGVVKPGRWKQ